VRLVPEVRCRVTQPGSGRRKLEAGELGSTAVGFHPTSLGDPKRWGGAGVDPRRGERPSRPVVGRGVSGPRHPYRSCRDRKTSCRVPLGGGVS
jgi:hypothetical protein